MFPRDEKATKDLGRKYNSVTKELVLGTVVNKGSTEMSSAQLH